MAGAKRVDFKKFTSSKNLIEGCRAKAETGSMLGVILSHSGMISSRENPGRRWWAETARWGLAPADG